MTWLEDPGNQITINVSLNPSLNLIKRSSEALIWEPTRFPGEERWI